METGFPGKLWGGYATHVFVPRQALVYKAPEELSDRATIIACSPFANGLRWFEATESKVGEHVLIVGPGPQGLCTALAAIAGGARVTVAGLKSVDDARLAYAASIGVHGTFAVDPSRDTALQASELVAEHGLVDAVIEVTASASGIDLAIQTVRTLGTVVTAASTPREYVVDWRSVHLKELHVIGQVSHPHVVPRALETAVRLQESDGLDMGEWVTHAFGLHEVGHAIRVASNETEERPIKVVLDPHLDAGTPSGSQA
jgi:threonine dehydrogenase-like Zn-dependent dehydrogenase